MKLSNKKPRSVEREETVCPKKKPRTADADETSPSPYLVVAHGSVSPAFSVFKVEPYADGGGDTPVSIPGHLARLKCKDLMRFVPLRLKDRRWIVGVGGGSSENDYGPGTIIFDTKTQSVIAGPEPKSIRSYPVLLPIGHKIYALSRSASIHGPHDFVPWFEVLNLSQEQEADGRLTNCKWRSLKRPPFFPWELTPLDYACPPSVIVKAYAAVDSRILVSVTGQAGTHAFDTESEEWATVDEQNDLPFAGGAVQHGHGLFLGVSRATNAIAGYKIDVASGALCVVEIPVVSEQEEPVRGTYNFLSLGIDRGFCLMSCSRVDKSLNPPHHRAHIRVRTYKTDGFVESDGKLLVVSEQWMQVYKIQDLVRTLESPCLAGVASI